MKLLFWFKNSKLLSQMFSYIIVILFLFSILNILVKIKTYVRKKLLFLNKKIKIEIVKVLPKDLSNRFRSKQNLFRMMKLVVIDCLRFRNPIKLICFYWLNLIALWTVYVRKYYQHITIDTPLPNTKVWKK